MSDSNSLHAVLVQPDLIWLDPQSNLKHLSQLLQQSLSLDASYPGSSQSRLIVLPEMFTSGFTQSPEVYINDGDIDKQRTVDWMKQQAALYDSAVVGSLACKVGDDFVNRLFFVYPNGDVSHYDKVHLFAMGDEHKRYKAGNTRRIVEYGGWRILLTICYDLRFPVFCRNQNDYDLMLCVANWPTARRHPWRTLLQARAIENQAYMIGANRVGVDGNGLEYNGDSMVVDFLGNLCADGANGKEQLLLTTLDKKELLEARRSFPVWRDADSFKLL